MARAAREVPFMTCTDSRLLTAALLLLHCAACSGAGDEIRQTAGQDDDFVPGSCSIFYASFGDRALYGNNEDWKSPYTYYWARPSGPGTYGGVYFGHLPEEPGGEWELEDLSAQGGVNEMGLCFDYAALPEAPVTSRPGRPSRRGIMMKMQAECATVVEAVALAREHDWGPSLSWQALVADATGDAVVMSAGKDGELAFTRKPAGDGYLVTTNYNRAQPENTFEGSYPCWRYDKVVEVLEGIEGEDDLTVERFRSILEAVHIESALGNTEYSNVYDLSNGAIHVYHWHQYGEAATLDINKEIARATKPTRLESLFSPATVKQAEAELAEYRRSEKSK